MIQELVIEAVPPVAVELVTDLWWLKDLAKKSEVNLCQTPVYLVENHPQEAEREFCVISLESK
ncbi:MAG: hypothetical protein AAF551_05835 [Bacteroidota bacterium]